MLFLKRNQRAKPLYKKLLIARENILNKKKILKFKKKKWKIYQFHFSIKLGFFNKYKVLDQGKYMITRDPKKGIGYRKRYRDTLNTLRNFKLFYGYLKKRTFKKLVRYAVERGKGLNKDLISYIFLKRVESTLDVVLFRSKFCNSIYMSRQLIRHGKVKVNGQIVKNKLYSLKIGDFIKVDPSTFPAMNRIAKNFARPENRNTLPHTPNHIFLNYRTMCIIFGNPENGNYASNFTFSLKLKKILLNYIKKL